MTLEKYLNDTNLFRLLKGAPPGQEAVNHYISELSIEKKNNSKLASKERKHLTMLEVNIDFLVDRVVIGCIGVSSLVWLNQQTFVIQPVSVLEFMPLTPKLQCKVTF